MISPDKLPKSGNYFGLKGRRSEEAAQYLAEKTFLEDWCYQNPKLPDGKELCDLLVVFDKVAIIWQIKDLKLQGDGKYSRSGVDKNLRQLIGARRKLFELKSTVNLSNPRRGVEVFNPKQIKEVYLVSALMGRGQELFNFVEEFKDFTIHVFDSGFTQRVLEELDTVTDFIEYLRAKEDLLRTGKRMMILGGEEELLAYYLMNGRSFRDLKKADFITVSDGIWRSLRRKPEYKAKKIEDKISYLWDNLIGEAHRSKSPDYEIVAREMARLGRFERRYLSKRLFEAAVISHNEDSAHNSYRRVVPGKGVTYCFLFMDDPEPRERRKAVLATLCFIARGKFPGNKRVLGIATEKKIRPLSSDDFCLLFMPSWSKESQQQMEDLQKQTGILTNPRVSKPLNEDEYPSQGNKN